MSESQEHETVVIKKRILENSIVTYTYKDMLGYILDGWHFRIDSMRIKIPHKKYLDYPLKWDWKSKYGHCIEDKLYLRDHIPENYDEMSKSYRSLPTVRINKMGMMIDGNGYFTFNIDGKDNLTFILEVTHEGLFRTMTSFGHTQKMKQAFIIDVDNPSETKKTFELFKMPGRTRLINANDDLPVQ